ncbi:LysM peptidoglycan-binding domain-containing protein [bacterium]|nr:LysM peptidoglycan-binding domain-containing protein [bacterium]
MTTGAFQKAKIEVAEGSKSGQFVEFMYNPTSLTVSKSVNWSRTPKPGGNAPETDFGGGDATTFSIPSVIFDGTIPLVGETAPRASIMADLDKLVSFMDIDDSLERPAFCRFMWGEYRSAQVTIEKVDITYQLFDRGGKPLRAEVSISFRQAEDPTELPYQNPTSRSYARKYHTVIEGETLDWIAHQEYGDAGAWRHIAEANNLNDPLNLRPGQLLRITPRN